MRIAPVKNGASPDSGGIKRNSAARNCRFLCLDALNLEDPMPTQTEQPTYDLMLWKLVDTTWTLTRLLSQVSAARSLVPPLPPAPLPNHQPGAAHPAGALRDDDIPMEPTSNVPQPGEGQLREPEQIIPSFDPVPPGKLGAEIVKLAQAELGRPVKEEYKGSTPANYDQAGHIKKYFVEGPRWKEETWHSHKEKHDGIGPAWCAAFVSYCWRGAHRSLGVELPLKLNAQCSVLWEQAHAIGRFLSPTLAPSPGDIVFLGSGSSPGHVGIVEKTGDDGIIYIIEGNAGENTDQLCRSRLIPGKPRYAKLMGFLTAEDRKPNP